ncbi:MAG: Rieske (2Fe-2S) protein [Actinomycetota bacterium]|nr:Rieske (2Fe-2S) protein [Actinomycetota bacterium]
MKTTAVSRRHALGGAATIGLGLPLLAACGDDGGTATEPSERPPSSVPGSEPPASAPTTKNGGPAKGIATTSEVPVGSGVVLADDEVVITQPTEGEFKAFTAICTHQGCTVVEVTDTINCTCHFSTFSITDGSPTGGPAPTPLAEIPISVDGNQISLA